MKKLLIGIFKSPVFVIRLINAALMRLLISYLLVAVCYSILFNIFFGQSPNEVFYNISVRLLSIVVSLIWGFLYMINKPPITKKTYDDNGYKYFIIFARCVIILCSFFALISDNQGIPLRPLIIFVFIEFIINTLILSTAKVGYETYVYIPTQRTKPKNASNSQEADKEEIYQQSEAKVDEILGWLKPHGYINIPKVHNYKNNCNEIRLRCNSVAEQSQEFDHIVVGKNGIFNIENKYYSGNIEVDGNGNWERTNKYGETKRDDNPLMQVDRHRAVLCGILGDDFPIIDIICISHPEAQLSINSKAPVPVIKYDVLSRYIQNYKSNRQLTAEQIKKVADLIEKHRVVAKKETEVNGK